jgi:mRNA-degrading endonuclease toxin of MazEF toxin-antitoxin module
MTDREFEDWHHLKKKIDREHHAPQYHDGEIWWCSVGMNIGHEQNGKNVSFSRPVLVVRKFNDLFFWGVPLTTQIKRNTFHYIFDFEGKTSCAILSQCRPYSGRRMISRMGRLSANRLTKIKEAIKDLL